MTAKCKLCKAPATLKAGLFNFCSVDCAYEYSKLARQEAQAKKQKEQKKQHVAKKKKIAIDDREKQKNLTQDAFNKMRRLEELIWFKERGIEPYCISCQKPIGNDVWACGHYKTRAARSDLAFDRMNTYLQHNVACNKHKSGDVKGMGRGFFIRFGEVEAKRIIEHCASERRQDKRTGADFFAMRKEFNAEIRRMQKILDSY
jgi:hypothetical protein